MQFIDLKTQYSLIEDDILSSIKKVLDHGLYIIGQNHCFRATTGFFCRVKHAIANSSGQMLY